MQLECSVGLKGVAVLSIDNDSENSSSWQSCPGRLDFLELSMYLHCSK